MRKSIITEEKRKIRKVSSLRITTVEKKNNQPSSRWYNGKSLGLKGLLSL
jgi:hypothetical protein